MNELNEALQNINWALIAPIIVLQLILMTVALIDLFRQSHVNGPKWLWLLIILVINIVGPVLYFIFGRGND